MRIVPIAESRSILYDAAQYVISSCWVFALLTQYLCWFGRNTCKDNKKLLSLVWIIWSICHWVSIIFEMNEWMNECHWVSIIFEMNEWMFIDYAVIKNTVICQKRQNTYIEQQTLQVAIWWRPMKCFIVSYSSKLNWDTIETIYILEEEKEWSTTMAIMFAYIRHFKNYD